ncbi:putative reverse transcriptase domain-containing protein [Tanacetum coccineum]
MEMIVKSKSLKNKSFANIQELFDKAMKKVNTFVDYRIEMVEESSKKAGTKLEEDKEFEELKQCLEIILDDGDDVTIDATPLSTKSPTIVDYKIYKEGKKNNVRFSNYQSRRKGLSVGIKIFLNDLRVTAAKVYVTAAKQRIRSIEVGSNKRYSTPGTTLCQGEYGYGHDNSFEFQGKILKSINEASKDLNCTSRADKMYYDLRDMYLWPRIKKDIAMYVSKCLTCSNVKAEHRKPSGITIERRSTFWKKGQVNAKKCIADTDLHVPLHELKIDDKLRFVEEPLEIMDREVKRLKRSRIPIVKVRWNSHRGPEFTWEREDEIKRKYPHLFVNASPLEKPT